MQLAVKWRERKNLITIFKILYTTIHDIQYLAGHRNDARENEESLLEGVSREDIREELVSKYN